MEVLNSIISAIIQLILFSLIPFIWWHKTYRKDEKFLHWIGLKKPVIKESKLKLILITLIISAGYIFFTSIVINTFMKSSSMTSNQFYKKGWSALPSILFYSVIQTALSEEILFRGFLGKRLINKFGFIIGNTIQAIGFGLLHGIPFGIITGNVLVTILLTLLPGALGWSEGLLNEKCSEGSIVPGWILHSIMNILSALSAAL